MPDTHMRDSNRRRDMDITRSRSNKREIDQNEVWSKWKLAQILYSASWINVCVWNCFVKDKKDLYEGMELNRFSIKAEN